MGFLILGIILFTLGLLLIIFNIILFCKCRLQIDAKIESLNKRYNRLRGTKVTEYNPVIKYEIEGKTYKCAAPFSSSNKDKYKVGNTLSIKINKNNPDFCRFKGRFGSLIFGLIAILVGITFIILYFNY